MALEKTEAPYDKTERLKHQQLAIFLEKVQQVLEKNEAIANSVNIKLLSDKERYSFEQVLCHFQTKKERFYQSGIVLWCFNLFAGLLACVLEEWITEYALFAIWVILLVIMGSYVVGCRMWVKHRSNAIIVQYAPDEEKGSDLKHKNGVAIKNLAADPYILGEEGRSEDSSDYNQ